MDTINGQIEVLDLWFWSVVQSYFVVVTVPNTPCPAPLHVYHLYPPPPPPPLTPLAFEMFGQRAKETSEKNWGTYRRYEPTAAT